MRDLALKRAVGVFLFLGLGALAVVARLFQIQIVEHRHWAQLAQRIQEEVVEVPARRGSILDRNGIALAYDVPAYDIALDNFHMTKPELLVDLLVDLLGMEPSEAASKVYREGYFTWIARRVERSLGEELRRKAQEMDIRGLLFFDTWKRAYPQGYQAIDLLGVVGVDGEGLEGLEYRFDRDLKGKPQRLRLVRGRDGVVYELWVEDAGEKGTDLQLTLDARIQEICAQSLDWGLGHFRARRGLAVVLDPRTGEILALAQAPRWSPKGEDPALLHPWAITDPFEPGSTFKALVGTAALEEGVVHPDDLFSGNSPYMVDGVPIANAAQHSYGTVTFARGIIQSINTVLIQVALRLGKERTYEYLRRFGIGERTGIELPGESPGKLDPPEKWTRVRLATISFGQGVAVTGVQLARAFVAIANDGLLPQLHLLAGKSPSPKRILSPQACATMRRILRDAVAMPGGTGHHTEVPGFGVAGKSGTAQKAVPGKGYSQEKIMGAMAAFFPWDAPEYVILVVYDEPSWPRPTWGGNTAGPTVARIIREMAASGLIHPFPRFLNTETSSYNR